MITCYICNQAAPSHKLDCPNRLGPVTISANSARILNDDYAELVDVRAKLTRIRVFCARMADESQHEGWDSPPVRRVIDGLVAILDGRADS